MPVEKLLRDMTQQELADFTEASNHPYECVCVKCRRWWEQVGPEENKQPIGKES